MAVSRCLVLVLLAATVSTARADALVGKRLYLDAARLAGTTVSCVDCHGGLPGGAFGIGAAANAPAVIADAIDAVPDMAPFRGRLTAQDLGDLAAYIGDPLVPSPGVALVATDGRPLDRIDFGDVELGSHVQVSFRLANPGQLPLSLTGDATLTGNDTAELELSTATCPSNAMIAPGANCDFTLDFRPTGAPGSRVARFAVPHDWVRGTAALAVLGSVVPDGADDEPGDGSEDEPGGPDVPADARDGGCTGAPGRSPLAAVLVLALVRLRRTRRSQGVPVE